MEKAEYHKHYLLEQDYWWFAGRREIILSMVRSLELRPEEALLLDAGCGTGINLQAVRPYGTAVGCDYEPDALRFCRMRGLDNLIQADIRNLPFAEGAFDVALLLDVLSHRSIASDVDVLGDVRRILKNRGLLLLTDSAFPFLWSRHDMAFHLRERYTRRALLDRMARAGLMVRRMSYFQFFFFLPLVILRLWERLWKTDSQVPVSNLKPFNRNINSLMTRIFKLELFLLKHVQLPFGSSLLLLAQKK
jgi:SAM-dependent methyltransferase